MDVVRLADPRHSNFWKTRPPSALPRSHNQKFVKFKLAVYIGRQIGCHRNQNQLALSLAKIRTDVSIAFGAFQAP